MKRLFLSCLLLAAVLVFPASALALEVLEGVITTQVADRAPVDSVETYPATVEKLFCFTRVVGGNDETVITHIWFHEGEEMARVELPVRSPNWRTWSSKKILSSWSGNWNVDILDADGNLLKTIPFTLL